MPDSVRAPPKRLTASGPPPVVGLLVDSLEDNYQWTIVRGAMDAARDRGAHLLCFAGGSLGAPRGEGGERNSVFDLARPACIDALIVMSGAIGNRIGPGPLREYCARFSPMPMCSIAVELEGMPSVCIDNEGGVRVALDHLIRHHGMRRVAFIRGPSANTEAEGRFAVYRESLEAAGIAFAERLVVSGNFEPSGGRDAVRTLLTERGLVVQDLDAIVAANDAMAFGALEALTGLGIGVPSQVAVVGFDDVEEARFAMPSLTTVRQPLYEQGRAAVRLVLERLEGGAPEERVVRSTALVTRRSCGCVAHETPSRRASIAPGAPRAGSGFEAGLIENHQLVLAEMSRASRGELSAAGAGWQERVFNSFIEQLRGNPADPFSLCYEDLLTRLSATDADLSVCNAVLSALRTRLLPSLAADMARYARAEDILHEARVMTAEAMERMQALKRMRAETRARALGRASAAIASAHDVDDLARAVAEHMPALGVARCYVATFDATSGDTRQARLALAHTPDAGRANAQSWQVRPAVDILRGLLPGAGEHAFAVLPTVFGDEELGLLVMELEGGDGYLYESLRGVFAAALAGAARAS